MATLVNLSIYTGAFPLITTNNLKYVVYKSSAFPAETSSQTFTPAHPARTVSFPGLERVNYIFKLLEMNGATLVRQVAEFNVVPTPDGGLTQSKDAVELHVGDSVGLVAGATSFVYDGTAGTPDWRGWDLYVERVGQGTIARDVHYTWDATTGTFEFIEDGITFQEEEFFNVEFNDQAIAASGGTPPAQVFSGYLLVESNTTLVAGDVGKNVVVKGLSSYLEITLPDITTVVDNMPIYIESGVGAQKCVRIKTVSGQLIDWLKGNRQDIKMGVCEDFAIYREPDTDLWRIKFPNGNFKDVGRIITTDADITDEFNCLELDGSDTNINDYARLYEDFVLRLDGSQVCTYAVHGVGTNKYKWSLASGSVFKRPDRRGLYVRNSDGVILPGVYQADTVGPILGLQVRDGVGGSSTNTIVNKGFSGQDNAGSWVDNDTGTPGSEKYIKMATVGAETRPKTVVMRQFVLV